MKSWKSGNSLAVTGALLFTALWLAGCTTIKTTSPARTATEQLLLSTATDHSLTHAGLGMFSGERVFLDAAYFDSYDAKYVLGAIRDVLSRAGALLADNATNCDVVMEARSGALSINDSDSFFGIPSVGVPVPLAGTVQTPEIAFFKSQKQDSVAKFALLAYAKPTRLHVYSSGSLDGKSYNREYKFFFLSWTRTDLPEKKSSQSRAEQYQTWFPQSDPENLTATNPPAKGK